MEGCTQNIQELINNQGGVEGFSLMYFLLIFKEEGKITWVKTLCSKHQINFLTIKETKMRCMDVHVVRSVWGNLQFDYAYSSSKDLSGGILYIWDKNLFHKSKMYLDDYLVTMEGSRLPFKTSMLFVSIYAP